MPLDRARTLDDYLWLSSQQQQFLMWLLTAFAVVTSALAGVGLYRVLSDRVSSRRHEFGIRLALGSSTSRVMRLVLAQGFWLALSGVAVGAVAAVFASRLLLRWLYQSSSAHVNAFVMSGAFLLLVALVACWVPSRKAASADPASLLRAE